MLLASLTLYTTKCRTCGLEFRAPKEYGRVLYCSAICRVSAGVRSAVEYKGCTKQNYYSKNRRKAIAAGDKIDPYVVYVAHNWICCLCHGDIDQQLSFPNQMAATLEHVIPLSDKHSPGHVWSNVAPAHLKCNQDKGSSLTNMHSKVII